ncbi:MAG: ATP-dependent Clp protease ATP-binding subunit ClpA, partial [Pseudomonadota bacterium]
GEDTEAINKMFTPEFRNRLDAVIPFAGLSTEVIEKVVEKFVFQLEAQLADRGVTIELSPEAAALIAERGYDDKFGARPLARLIQEEIKKPLADELLFGQLKHGGTVKVVIEGEGKDRKIDFEYIAGDPSAKPKSKWADEDADDDDDDEIDGDEPQAALVDAEARKALPGPEDEKPAASKPTRRGGGGAVPSVPRKKDS